MNYDEIISKLKTEKSEIIIPSAEATSKILDKLRTNDEDEKTMLEKLANEDYEKKKIKPVPDPEKQRLDIIMAFDTTGSMSAYIKEVRENIGFVSQALFDTIKMRIALVGIGDHCDGDKMMQIRDYTTNITTLKQNIESIANTGGGDAPEAYECLFKELNRWEYPNPTAMVMIIDSYPHGMSTKSPDNGCPFKVDYKKELTELKTHLKNLYIVSCGNRRYQEQFVDEEKCIIDLKDIKKLPHLIVGMCMSEVGRLGYFMRRLEE